MFAKDPCFPGTLVDVSRRNIIVLWRISDIFNLQCENAVDEASINDSISHMMHVRMLPPCVAPLELLLYVNVSYGDVS